MTWRAIQDTVALSESLARLSDFAERLFWRMISRSDPWGRLPGTAAKLRALCVPLLPVGDDDVAAAIAELVAAGRLRLYSIDGEWYAELVDFDRNQPKDVVSRDGKRFASRYPDPSSAAPRGTPRHSAASRRGNQEGADLQGTPRHAAECRVPPAETETETETETENCPVKGRDKTGGLDTPAPPDALPISRPSGNGQTPAPLTWKTVHEHLSGADERTPEVIARSSQGLPEAALHTAWESLEARRRDESRKPLQSEVRYFVATLKTMRDEGQYG